MSLAFQELPSPQHLVGGVTECDQLCLHARLCHLSLGSALSVDRSLSQGAACVTFHIGVYGKGCIDVCNNMNRFKHFKSYTHVLSSPYVRHRTDQLVIVVPLGLQYSLSQERHSSQNIWPRPLAQVE